MKPLLLFSLRTITCTAIIALAIASCKDSKPHFTVEGKISDADSVYLYLEERTLTATNVIDSIRLDKGGSYNFEAPSPAHPEFYALRLNNQLINFAVDSTEALTINASGKAFAREYSIEGSDNSAKMKIINQAQYKLADILRTARKDFGEKKIDQNAYPVIITNAVNEYRDIAENIIKADYKSMAAYYALFQKVDGMFLFDPYEKKDVRLFQTVATSWKQFRSDEPRAAQLEKFTLSALAELRNFEKQDKLLDSINSIVKHVEKADYYDITLPDINNKPVSLSSLKGKVVILDFTAYQSPHSSARNILINSVYEKYKGKVDVYQISFDTDDHVWRNVAANLPWTSVKDPKSVYGEVISKYNIQGLPATYLLDRNGEIVKRLGANDDLEAAVKKIL